MNLLFTCARMPFVLDEIRKVGAEGVHRVDAADSFGTAPGSHSSSPGFRVGGFGRSGFIAGCSGLHDSTCLMSVSRSSWCCCS